MFTSIAAYHFTPVDAPHRLAEQTRAWATRDALLGTVLVAGEGINVFLAGNASGIDAFLASLRGDPRFAGIIVKRSVSATPPFARLKIKAKDEIIRFGRDEASPLHGRAPSVSPQDLARWIDRGTDDDGRALVMLDTRNREEVAHGTFDGALTLAIDNFTELPDALAPQRAALSDATVVSFCTGGIRCEKAALWMRASGMDNVLQLDGGILGYFDAVGGAAYRGDCFVFDERIALDPRLRAVTDAVCGVDDAARRHAAQVASTARLASTSPTTPAAPEGISA